MKQTSLIPIKGCCLLTLITLFLVACTSAPTTQANPEAARTHFHEAQQLANNWEFEAAIDAIDKAIELDPGNAEYVMYRGIYLDLQGDRLALLRALDKALEMEPDSVRFLNNRASALTDLGMFDEALADIQRARNLDNEKFTITLLHTQAWLHYRAGEYDESTKLLDEIESRFPEDANGTVSVRFLILNASQGIDAAREYGRDCLATRNLNDGDSTALRLIMGEVDLRDIPIPHPMWLTWYISLLEGFEYYKPQAELNTPEDSSQSTETENPVAGRAAPVVLVREVKTTNTDETMKDIVTQMLTGVLMERTTFRLVDTAARAAALEELETRLAGLTEAEGDMELGRFLAADFILSGSLAFIQNRYFCNLVVTNAVNAEILFSKFFVAEAMEDIEGVVDSLVNRINS